MHWWKRISPQVLTFTSRLSSSRQGHWNIAYMEESATLRQGIRGAVRLCAI